MKTNRIINIVLQSMIIAMLSGCQQEESEVKKTPEPRIVTINSNMLFSYDNMQVGNFPLGMGDDTSLIGTNGFDYCGDERGGAGHTLQLISYQIGVHLTWAWGALNTIEVFVPWNGRIESTDIRLGDTLDKFLAAYPNAIQSYSPFFSVDASEPFWHTTIYIRDYQGSYGNSTIYHCLTIELNSDNTIKMMRIYSCEVPY